MLILAFFIVFFIGVCTCFYQALKAINVYHIQVENHYAKHGHLLVAILNIALGIAGIGGVVQATISAGVL